MADESDIADMQIVIDGTADPLRRATAEADRLVEAVSRKIDRNLSNVDGAFDRMGGATKTAAAVVRSSSQGMADDSGQAFTRISTSSRGAARAVESDSQSMVRDFGTVSTAVKLAAGVLGGFELVSSIKDAALLSARYNQLGIVVNTLGGNAGYSRAQLADFQSELQRTGISAIESRNNISKMIAVQLDLANASKLARLAQDAAVIANTNSSEAFGNLVDGIASAEVETLRAMGLNTNFENGYKTLAVQLGKNVNDLTEQEKAQSRVNSALAAGTAIHGAYEASLSSASKILSSTKRYVQDLEVQLGQAYQPAFESGVNAYSDALKGLAGHTDEVTQVLKTGLYLAVGQAATALASKATATLDSARADIQAKAATADAAVAEVRRIEALQAGNAAKLESARLNRALAVSEAELKASGAALGAARRQELLLEGQLQAAKAASATANATLAASSSLLGRTLTGLANTARGLWAALGGPVGLLFTAGAVALSFVDFSTKTEELKTTLGDLTTPLDQVLQRFQKLSEVEKDVELRNLGTRIKQLNQEMGQAGVDAADSFGANLAAQLMAQRGSIGVEGLLDLTSVGNDADQATALVRQSFADAARGVNVDWSAVIEKLRNYNGVSDEMVVKVQDAAVALQQHQRELAETKARQDALNGSVRENVAAQTVANAIVTDKAGQAYLDQLSKQAVLVGKTTELEKLRANIKAGFIVLDAEAEKKALDAAAAIDRVNAAIKAATTSRKDSTKAAKDEAKATQELIDKAFPEEKRLRDLVANIKGLQELQGKGKITALQYAQGLKTLNEAYAAPAVAKRTQEEEKAAAALKKSNEELQKLLDQLDPKASAAREHTEQQKLLNDAIAKGGEKTAYLREMLAKLDKQYADSQKDVGLWGSMTEGAIDRVDSAFADAWANIGSGGDSLFDRLKKGFKQTLGEIAHMLTTKPLMASISNWLTGTDNGQGLGAVWGKLLGTTGGGTGSGSGGSLGSLFQSANTLRSLYGTYQTATALYPVLTGGYTAGGLSGAVGAVGSYLGTYLGGSGAAASAAAGSTAAGYTGSAYAAWAASQGAGAAAGAGAGSTGMLASLGSYASTAWPLAVIAGMYASGKLYSAGVRPDAGAMKDSYDEGGTLGKVVGFPAVVGAKYFEAADKLLGSVVGGKWAAIINGSTVFQAVYTKVAEKLFGGSWQTKDAGYTLGVDGGELQAGGYELQKRKGGWLKKGGKRTVPTALDDEAADYFDGIFGSGMLGIESLFRDFGIEVTDSALAGLKVATSQISTMGKSQEEVQKLVNDWFTQTFDSVTDQINAATGSQFKSGLTFAGLQTLMQNLLSVNGMLETLNVAVLKINAPGAYAAEALQALAGGMEQLSTNVQGYYGAFFSESEKQADSLAAVRKQFEALNITLPTARDGYRAMVEALDVTTAAGQAMFTTLTSLATTASSAYDILEAQAKAAAQAQAEAQSAQLSAALAAVQRSVEQQKKVLSEAYNRENEQRQAQLTTAQGSVSSLTGMANSLSNALKSLQGQSAAATAVLYRQGRATLDSALAIAQAGGSLAGFEGLDDALAAVTGNREASYGNWEDFTRDQGQTAVVVAQLKDTAGSQLTSAQQAVALLNRQITQAKVAYDAQTAQLDSQLAFAQSQLDALNGIDNSLLDLAEALKQFAAAVKVAAPGGTGAVNADQLIANAYQSVLGRAPDKAGAAYWKDQLSSGSLSSNDLYGAINQAGAANGESIKAAYQAILGRAPDAAGMAYWQQQVAAGSVTDVQAAIRAAAVANGSIPAFATGGNHAGGFRIVGENGPELELTGPSRIFSASQTAQAFAGAGVGWSQMLAELRAQRQELSYLRQQLVDINDNTGQASRRLRDMSIAGG